MTKRKCRAENPATCTKCHPKGVSLSPKEEFLAKTSVVPAVKVDKPSAYHTRQINAAQAQLDAQPHLYQALLQETQETEYSLKNYDGSQGQTGYNDLVEHHKEQIRRRARADKVILEKRRAHIVQDKYEQTDKGFNELSREIAEVRMLLDDSYEGLDSWEMDIQREHLKGLLARFNKAESARID